MPGDPRVLGDAMIRLRRLTKRAGSLNPDSIQRVATEFISSLSGRDLSELHHEARTLGEKGIAFSFRGFILNPRSRRAAAIGLARFLCLREERVRQGLLTA